MKKIVAISLLSLIFLGQAGYYCIIEAIREVHKEEMIKKIIPFLKEEDLVKIPAEDKAIYWSEEGKEFIYNGMMYDVVKAVKEDKGHIIYYCLADGKEDKLNLNCNKVTGQNSSQESNHKNIKVTNITLEYIQPSITVPTVLSAIQASSNFIEKASEKKLDCYGDVASPPPRV